MTFRTPRGYAVSRPPYQELSQGIRPEASTVPMAAWTGLPVVRVDEIHHDPIVLEAGTIVGIASGGYASGKIFPAHGVTGAFTLTGLGYTNADTDWGLPASDVSWTAANVTAGPVLPLGVVYQPIYSFILQEKWTNYKRNDSMGFVTDYLIQVPARTSLERSINPGDLVQAAHTAAGTTAVVLGNVTTAQYAAGAKVAGTFQTWTGTAGHMSFVIGRCLQKIRFATGTASSLALTDSAVALTAAGQAEFKGLEKVQTVPGIAGVAGSSTSGIPGWLTAAVSDASGAYFALTILVRL